MYALVKYDDLLIRFLCRFAIIVISSIMG